MTITVPMREIDHEIWEGELDDFVPKKLYDAHVHLSRTAFDMGKTPQARAKSEDAAKRGFGNNTMAFWQTWNAALFPGREVHGFCMGSPYPEADIDGLNQFVAD